LCSCAIFFYLFAQFDLIDEDTGYDNPDIVYNNDNGIQYFSAVAADYWGNPIVLVFDDTATPAATTNLMTYNSVTSEWVNLGDAGVAPGNDTSMHVDRNGVITFGRDGSYITRMWRPDVQVRDQQIRDGANRSDLILDRKYLMETGDFHAVPVRSVSYPDLAIIHVEIGGRPDTYPIP
jgi:hypothetical protein